MNKITESTQVSFSGYVCSIICCRSELKKYYKIQLKAIRKLISIHTYTNMVISNANQDEYEVYEYGMKTKFYSF